MTAVVVTRHRADLLVDGLAVVAKQTRPPDHLIVVDNGPDEATRAVVENCGLPVTYLPSHHNLGGAGGYALGMLTALARGTDWLWLADDDGRPVDEHVLATLLDVARRRGLAEVSPVIADIDDPDRLAFPLRQGLHWMRRRSELAAYGDDELLPGIAHLFNGALFRASTLDVIGVPDLRLFVRGDEVEVHRRLARSGLPYGIVPHHGLRAPRRLRRVQADARRTPARPGSGRRHEALLHVPQPWLSPRPAGSAPVRGDRAPALRLVLPGLPPGPRRAARVAVTGPSRTPRALPASLTSLSPQGSPDPMSHSIGPPHGAHRRPD